MGHSRHYKDEKIGILICAIKVGISDENRKKAPLVTATFQSRMNNIACRSILMTQTCCFRSSMVLSRVGHWPTFWFKVPPLPSSSSCLKTLVFRLWAPHQTHCCFYIVIPGFDCITGIEQSPKASIEKLPMEKNRTFNTAFGRLDNW